MMCREPRIQEVRRMEVNKEDINIYFFSFIVSFIVSFFGSNKYYP